MKASEPFLILQIDSARVSIEELVWDRTVAPLLPLKTYRGDLNHSGSEVSTRLPECEPKPSACVGLITRYNDF